MSELFESLRHRTLPGTPQRPAAARRTNTGEAVLATLGYSRVRRWPRMSPVAAVLLIGGIVLAGYAVWRMLAFMPGEQAPPAAVGRSALPPPPATPSVTRTSPAEPELPGAEGSPGDAAAAPEPSAAGARAGAPELPTTGPEARHVEAEDPPVAVVPAAVARTRRSAAVGIPPPGLPVRPPAAAPAAASAVRPGVAPPPRAVPAPAPESTRDLPDRAAAVLDDFSLGVYYQRLGDYDNAVARYRDALKSGEVNPRVHNNLGLLHLDRGRVDDAVRELERAVALDPGYVTGRLNLAVALMRRESNDAAAAQLRAVLAAEPQNVDALVNLALVERTASTPERAKELLLRALAVAPHHPAAHYNLAVLYDSIGEARRALEHYRAFLDAARPEHAATAVEVRARVAALSR